MFTCAEIDIVTMEEEDEARKALLNIQEEIRRDLVKEKELQEARKILQHHHLKQPVNNQYNCSLTFCHCLSLGPK